MKKIEPASCSTYVVRERIPLLSLEPGDVVYLSRVRGAPKINDILCIGDSEGLTAHLYIAGTTGAAERCFLSPLPALYPSIAIRPEDPPEVRSRFRVYGKAIAFYRSLEKESGDDRKRVP